MKIQKIGVLGCGTMGVGIAQVILQHGYEVVVNDTEPAFVNRGIERIGTTLEKLEKKGKISAGRTADMRARLNGSTRLEDLFNCDLIVEAVFEDLEVKKTLFQVLDQGCKAGAIFASNTSSLSITQMAAFTQRPARFAGLHFFNPVPFNPLVEVVQTLSTPPSLIKALTSFVESLEKVAVVAQDNAGFIVNMLLTPFMLSAMQAAGNQVATVKDIDTAMKLGCSHPMGPLMLADFIGLDVIYNASRNMFDEYRDLKYAPPPILKKMVLSGRFGQKSGIGFYDWSDMRHPEPAAVQG